MTNPLRVSAPQFRTALIRKLRNIAPAYEPEFLDADRGIAFRMKDKRGRARSLRISIYRNSGHVLERANLERLLASAGFPAVLG
jgi:hypothetical protein